tara:strand:+ start:722 stop:1048 length:327 start_codon:yes stop_codon:yes gene_type:complete
MERVVWTKEKGQHTVTMTDAEVAEYNQMQTERNSDAEKLNRIKEIRQIKLNETDWWVFRGNMTTVQSTYRQKLRDIPQDYTASDYDALLEMEGEIPNRKLKHTVWSKP